MYRYSVVYIVYIFIITSIIKPQNVSISDSCNNIFYINLTGGIGNEELIWSIAGSKNNPNILSELHWYGLKSFSTGIEFEGNIYKDLFYSADATYGTIYKGQNRDSDYGEDNKANEVFRSINKSDKGNIWNLCVGIGYMFPFSVGEVKCIVSPSLGYYYGSQKLYITDAMQEIPFDEEIIGVNSTYKTKWESNFGWVGINLYLKFSDSYWAKIIHRYHDIKYYAEADWNLIDEFMHPKSFEHIAYGYGIQSNWSISHLVSKKMSIIISIEYNYWTTGKGTDRLFRTDGTALVTILNKVTSHSFGTLAGISIAF